MSKMLLAVVASLATLVATSGAAKCAFSVAFTVAPPAGGNSDSGSGPSPGSKTLTTTSTSTPTSTLTVTSNTISIDDNASQFSNIVLQNFTTTAGQNANRAGLLTSFLVRNNRSGPTGATSPVITIVVTQDAFTYPVVPVFFTSSYTASFSQTGVSALPVISVVATASGPQSPITLSGFGSQSGQTGAVTSGGSGNFITQTFTITNLAPGQIVNFLTSEAAITTPLPATGLMAAVGFPLLGLAGAFRRRVLG